MDNEKSDGYYIAKALNEINIIIKYMEGINDYDEFVKDDMRLDGILFRMIQMVEQIKFLSEDYKAVHSDIPWGEIIGFRNGLVHEYGKTDYIIVYEIASRDIFLLKKLFERTGK